MTYTPTLATGNGSQVDFSFTFPYLNQLDVKATINGTPTTDFTFFSASILRFNTAPANGAAIVIFRETNVDDLDTVLQAGSALPVDGLNNNFLQSLYFGQETEYNASNQSTAGLQDQITAATNTANTALSTANTAEATANAISGVATAAQNTANAALPKAGGTMTGTITFAAAQTGIHTPNLLTNSNFRVNQRDYGSGTPTTVANQYTLDRWRVNVSGESIIYAVTNGLSLLVVPAGGITQIIEAQDVPVSNNYVLNWVGSATGFVNGVQRTKDVPFFWAGSGNMTVEFFNGSLGQPKLEFGPQSTPWVPVSASADLAACQRYYWARKDNLNLSYPSYASGAVQSFPVQFPVTMRDTPTLSSNFTGVTLTNVSSIVWNNANINGARIVLTSNATAVSAVAAFVTGNFIAADAELT